MHYLIARFAVYEAEQLPEATCKSDANGASSTLQSQRTEKGRRLQILVTTETVTVRQEVQVQTEEVGPDRLYVRDGPSMATTPSGELDVAPGMYTPIPAWPWAGGVHFNHTLCTIQFTGWGGLPSMAWPGFSLQFSGWRMPYLQFILPAQPSKVASTWVWPYSAALTWAIILCHRVRCRVVTTQCLLVITSPQQHI